MAGLNGVPDDSAILIDNVLLTVVPEPSTMILLAAGGVGLVVLRRRPRAGP
jgi:hypothetical protein